MEASDHLRSASHLTPGKEPPVPIE